MREFNYRAEADRLLTHKSVEQIGYIYGFIGEKRIVQQESQEILETLERNCLIQSITTSTKNNGIRIPFDTILGLIDRSLEPQNETEHYVLRYSRALSSITKKEYPHVNMVEDILRLNSMLFYDDIGSSQHLWRVHNMPYKRKSKSTDICFDVPPPEQSRELFSKICEEYSSIIAKGEINPLYLMPVFLLDFTAIQPFDRGYYETSRLIIAYLLEWADLDYTNIISLEYCLQKHREFMFQKIGESLSGWHEGTNHYQSAFDLWMTISLEARFQFEEWVKLLLQGKPTTKEIVKKIIKLYDGGITKRAIMEFIPHISESRIEMALHMLIKSGEIKKLYGGRYSQYVMNALE